MSATRRNTIFERFNDLEGVAGVEFNLSMVLLSDKNLKGALEHFKLGAQYPFLPTMERKERENYFVRRARENGFKNVNLSPIG